MKQLLIDHFLLITLMILWVLWAKLGDVNDWRWLIAMVVWTMLNVLVPINWWLNKLLSPRR